MKSLAFNRVLSIEKTHLEWFVYLFLSHELDFSLLMNFDMLLNGYFVKTKDLINEKRITNRNPTAQALIKFATNAESSPNI